MNNLLVLGGSGFVGRSVCDKLVERSGGAGGRITVPSRRPQRAKHLQQLPTVRVVAADVHDPAQLRALVRGCDAVINLVAILHGNEQAFYRAHVALPRKLADACNDVGVRRLVHVSALGVGEPGDPPAPSHYLRSKAAGEVVLRGADARFQPVWVQDVAAAVLRCLDLPKAIGQTFECAGPQVLTLRQIVEAAGRGSGHPRPVFGLPDSFARIQALLMELLPGEPLMSRDNLASMRTANVATGRHPGLAALGITAASLDAVAPGYLAAHQGIARLDRWRARAP